MTYKRFFTVLTAFAMLTQTVFAKQIGGIQMPDSRKVGDAKLVLNGAGIRTKAFFNIYVGGLYLRRKSQDATRIIKANDPMAVRLHIVSRLITDDRMIAATREGFKKSTKGNTAPIQKRIERFLAIFKKQIKNNDVYEFVYTPGKGTLVYRNDKLKATFKGLEFKQALFGIWLSDDPVHEGLKKGLLGK